MSIQAESAIMKHELDDVRLPSLAPDSIHPQSLTMLEVPVQLSSLQGHDTVKYRRAVSTTLIIPSQAQENLREERRQGAGLQQQLAHLQEAAQGSAQSAMQLDAQAKQLATQLQHSQATSHTLQKLIQVWYT